MKIKFEIFIYDFFDFINKNKINRELNIKSTHKDK